MTQPERTQWRSRLGFVLAASGSAIGLGNIVFFGASAYKFGGGAFYLPYLVALENVHDVSRDHIDTIGIHQRVDCWFQLTRAIHPKRLLAPGLCGNGHRSVWRCRIVLKVLLGNLL